MTQTDIASTTRRAKRMRVLGKETVCAKCGFSDSTALTKTSGSTLCYECQCLRQAKPTLEHHHHLGRASDAATIAISGNIHRSLSDAQLDWPPGVLRNPERDPLLWLAAALLGLRDHLAWWVAWIDRIAHWLATLQSQLQQRDGVRWWETMDLAPVWQDVSS